jgi:hypothetical protein
MRTAVFLLLFLFARGALGAAVTPEPVYVDDGFARYFF